MVKISKSFLKSSLIYTVAGALPTASAIVLLPFYTKYLELSSLGALAIYLTFSLLIQYITTYSFDISLYIHYHEFKNDQKKLSAFVSSAFSLMAMIGVGSGLVMYLAGDWIFRIVYPNESISFHPFGLLAVATGVFQALFKVFGNLTQSRERPSLFLWSNVAASAMSLALTVIGMMIFPNTLIGPVGGRFISASLMGTWALLMIFREFGIHFDFQLLRSSFSFNFYTFLYQLLQWVINHLDRFLISFFLALSAVGVYDFTIKCLLIIEFLLNGLHNSFYPRVVSEVMAQTDKSSTPQVNRYYHGFIAVIMVLTSFCILTFPWAIETFVQREEYHLAIAYVPYIASLYIFRSIRLFFAVPYGILKFSRPLPLIYLCISAIKVGGLVLFIKDLSLYGVILASALSAVGEIILLRFSIGDRFTYRFNTSKILVAPLMLYAIINIAEPLLGKQYPLQLHAGYFVLTLILLLWVYRNEVRLINPMKLLR